jgi:tetratricopeptide (TPR) repeat protein
MLQRAYASMKKRYGFTPAGPIGIEMFAKAEHFSVRTTGLPNAGVQGVCFGKVITAVSPRAGPFNWGQILWHELSHVFHLQMSHNHVPRWFTEGLAEHETTIARPEWKREDDHTLAAAVRADSLPHLPEMNRAFTSARSAEAIMTAYYASSLAVGYIVQRFGDAKVAAMLRAWGRGLRTEDVFQHELGVSIEAVDAGFREQLEARLAPRSAQFEVELSAYADRESLAVAASARPTDADAIAALAAGQLVADQTEDAGTTAKRALRLSPQHALAHFVLAHVALHDHNARLAEACLRAIITGGKDGYELRLLLAKIALTRHDSTGARNELEAAARLDAERPEAWQGLSEIAEQASDQPLRLRALKAQVDIDQHDGELHLAWMTVQAEAGQWQDVIVYGERALYMTPERAELHALLGDAYARQGRGQEAVTELDRAIALHHPLPGAVHVSRARAYQSLRQFGQARTAAQAAISADPALQAQIDALHL